MRSKIVSRLMVLTGILSVIVVDSFSAGNQAVFGKHTTIRIGIVYPTFTAAAYNNSFYRFYSIYGVSGPPPVKNVTTNLNLLTSYVDNHIGSSANKRSIVANQTHGLYLLYNHLKSMLAPDRVDALSDPEIDNGSAVFNANGTKKYDILILGHQEYVTQNEYENLKHFVRMGGTMIILDGNIFYAEVKYDRNTHRITLVEGHSWAFNGKSAWRSINERWADETSAWVGSNSYLAPVYNFTNNPFNYRHFEEQYITNPNAKVIMNYGAATPVSNNQQFNPVIATYQMKYHKGKVIVFGIYADRETANNKFLNFFDTVLLKYTLVSKLPLVKNISLMIPINPVHTSTVRTIFVPRASSFLR